MKKVGITDRQKSGEIQVFPGATGVSVKYTEESFATVWAVD